MLCLQPYIPDKQIREDFAGEVLEWALDDLQDEYGFIPTNELIESRTIRQYCRRLNSPEKRNGKRVYRHTFAQEYQLAAEDFYMVKDTEEENDDPLEQVQGKLLCQNLQNKYGDGDNWFINMIEPEEIEETELDRLTLLVQCFGKKYLVLLKLYLEWLDEKSENQFSQSSLATFLGISKQGVHYKLKCLSPNDVKRIIQLSTYKID